MTEIDKTSLKLCLPNLPHGSSQIILPEHPGYMLLCQRRSINVNVAEEMPASMFLLACSSGHALTVCCFFWFVGNSCLICPLSEPSGAAAAGSSARKKPNADPLVYLREFITAKKKVHRGFDEIGPHSFGEFQVCIGLSS